MARPQVRAVLTNIQTNAQVADVHLTQWSVTRRVNNTGSWSVQLPMIVPRASQLENYCSISLLLDGVELISGRVDKVSRKMSGDRSVYAVSGLGEAEALSRFMAKDTSHYQNVNILLILNDLLTYAGWAVGSTATVLNNTLRTTIDLRNEEHILPQIQKVCDSTPGLFWRYGGRNMFGTHTLDFGFFDRQESIQVAQAGISNRPDTRAGFSFLKDIDFVETHSNLVYEIAGYGGAYIDGGGDEQIITLANSLSAYPALGTDPDFPIMVGDAGQLVVRNVALYPVGGTIRRKFDIYVTENTDPPSVQEINEAAHALWQRCVRFLQENQYSDEEYSVDAVGNRRWPEVGNRIWVDANQVSGVACAATGRKMYIPGLQVHGSLRVGEWQISGSNDMISTAYRLTAHEYISYNDDADIQMYDTVREKIPNTSQFGSLMGGKKSTYATTDTIVPAGQFANCFASGDPSAQAGLAVTVPIAGYGAWVTVVNVIDISIPGYNWDVIQNAAWPATNLILCIYPNNGTTNWSVGNSATISVTWQRTT